MRLDPVSLSLFVAVIEEGTIAAAAERSHIAASAVSKRLSELESGLGTQLLNRSNKGIEPTAAGNVLLKLARGALRELDEIYFQMRDYSSGVKGHVRLYANISAISQFLPQQLKSFFGRYPQVHVDVEERLSAVIARAVAENQADIGILSSGVHGYDLQTFSYEVDEFVLIVPADHALAERAEVDFAETLAFDYVVMHAGSSINLQLMKSAGELGRSLNVRMQVTSIDAVRAMVNAGLGIALVPRRSATAYAPGLDIRVVGLKEEWARRQLSLCVRSLESLPVAGRLLVQHLVPRAGFE
jgi:DNA-binding transcriptional LysR family regulator